MTFLLSVAHKCGARLAQFVAMAQEAQKLALDSVASVCAHAGLCSRGARLHPAEVRGSDARSSRQERKDVAAKSMNELFHCYFKYFVAAQIM